MAPSWPASKPVALQPESWPTVAVVAQDLAAWQGDLLAVAVAEDDLSVVEGSATSIASSSLKALDEASNGAVTAALEQGGFAGKQGEKSGAVRVGSAGVGARYLTLLGLGKADKLELVAKWGPGPFQALGTSLAAVSKSSKAKRVALGFLDQQLPSGVDPAGILAKVASATLLGSYESHRFKTKPSPSTSKLESLEVLSSAAPANLAEGLLKGQSVASGTQLTRYLVEAPPNVCTPSHLAAAAQHIADLAPDVLKLTVLEKEQCEALGMGSFLGVAESSEEPVKLIHLVYTPPGGATKKVAVVGKGLTFDSGGYNIKAGPGSMIELMKFDMAGAAATLGAARILAGTKPAGVEVHFIVASCENMVAGCGLRPGDILVSAAGKTIEVNNTDAEGRLTLVDALWYAQEKAGVSAVVDIATLTGAVIVALGGEVAALYANTDEMAEAVTSASQAAGEKVWRLPLEQSYWEQYKSPVADMKNSGGREAGSITAALFLKEFINEGVEWAHLDIAGTCWNNKEGLPTGYGAALLAEWATAQAPQ